jgi:hypothetical protein
MLPRLASRQPRQFWTQLARGEVGCGNCIPDLHREQTAEFLLASPCGSDDGSLGAIASVTPDQQVAGGGSVLARWNGSRRPNSTGTIAESGCRLRLHGWLVGGDRDGVGLGVSTR